MKQFFWEVEDIINVTSNKCEDLAKSRKRENQLITFHLFLEVVHRSLNKLEVDCFSENKRFPLASCYITIINCI